MWSIFFIDSLPIPHPKQLENVLPKRSTPIASLLKCPSIGSVFIGYCVFCLFVGCTGHVIFLILILLSLNLIAETMRQRPLYTFLSSPKPSRPPTTTFGWLSLLVNKQRPHNSEPPPLTLIFPWVVFEHQKHGEE